MTFLLLEIGLYLLISNDLVPISLPSYRFSNITPFWVNNKQQPWGTWHAPNREYLHRKSCFNVTYQTNDFGMRDRPRKQLGEKRRVVVLGDSFVEGWGVDRDHRFTDQLEALTSMPHLNFGTSGSFGPTQYLTLYEDFALQFSHDAVIVAVLPNNDFVDDDLEYGKRKRYDQYRPYLVGEYPNYQVIHYNENSLANTANVLAQIAEATFREFSHLARALDYVRALRKHQAAEKELKRPMQGVTVPSPYFDYTEQQWLRLKFALEQIDTLSGTRDLLVFTIPRPYDFIRAANEQRIPPLTEALLTLAKEHGFVYLDFLAPMSATSSKWSDYFHTCDGHWSNIGHTEATKLLSAWSYYDSGQLEEAGRKD